MQGGLHWSCKIISQFFVHAEVGHGVLQMRVVVQCAMSWYNDGMRFRFPISVQISIFLVIVAFIPVAAVLMLKTYENQLLSLTEHSNVQQARLLAASLSYANKEQVLKQDALGILQNMRGQFDSRIRILDGSGALLADSSRMHVAEEDAETLSVYARGQQNGTSVKASETFVYKLFSIPVRLYRKLRPPLASYTSADYYTGKAIYDGAEIQAALRGRYGAVTRISSGGQVSVTLYSAVPVINGEQVIGVVLVSRSTYRILQNLYELRVDLGRIFLWSLLVVVFVALFLAFRISRPLKKLSWQTGECADKKGGIVSTEFIGQNRHDEIGDLSRSFTLLIKKLNQRIRYTQAFSADISHEFKNPLAAIRSSAELLETKPGSTQERQMLVRTITDEVTHLQTVLSGVRGISKIDSALEAENMESIPLAEFVQNVALRIRRAYPETNITVAVPDTQIVALCNPDHFDRLLTNLVENAASLADQVCITLERTVQVKRRLLVLTVEDNGPGITYEESKKIFDRFYSNRREPNAGTIHAHTGLGLSIVKAIVDASEGTIAVGQSAKLGGAQFVVHLPYMA